jgi:hypothetical protein
MAKLTTPRRAIVPIGPSIAYIPLTRGLYALIDSDRAAECEANVWYANRVYRGTGFYAERCVWTEGKKIHISMHRQLFGSLPEGRSVDHKSCNGLDNRTANLRSASRSEQQRNQRKKSTNTSGLKGASRIGSRWSASIFVNYRQIHLGCFATAEEAHAAYCDAARQLHGEFQRIA